MKAEYDKCEEYWAGKVEEERRLHGDEQRAADQRLADLAARVHDYERQFALPPIDERPKLEAQVNDLQVLTHHHDRSRSEPILVES